MLNSQTASSWLKVSPIEILISRACEPSLHEPNYALHIEVAEYINNKKANKCVGIASTAPKKLILSLAPVKLRCLLPGW